jgi:tetratricopeptide (TPR) repeat protein
MATAFYMQGDYDAAIAYCDEVIRQEANFGPAWNNLALAHFEKGEFARAVECADTAQRCGFEVRGEFLAELAPHR